MNLRLPRMGMLQIDSILKNLLQFRTQHNEDWLLEVTVSVLFRRHVVLAVVRAGGAPFRSGFLSPYVWKEEQATDQGSPPVPLSLRLVPQNPIPLPNPSFETVRPHHVRSKHKLCRLLTTTQLPGTVLPCWGVLCECKTGRNSSESSRFEHTHPR